MKPIFYFISFSFYVYYVFGVKPFINKGKRAELFEITDNEVPVFKINLSEKDYALLKQKSVLTRQPTNLNVYYKDILARTKVLAESILEIIKFINFSTVFKGENLYESFPELNIGRNGYPNINSTYVINNIKWEPSYYTNFDFGVGYYLYNILNTNPYFDLVKIIRRIVVIDTDDLKGVDSNSIDMINRIKNTLGYSKFYDFKTKNAKMTVDINGGQKRFDNVTFSIGGVSTRYYEKPGFNIKIGDGKNLYGRKHLRLRAEYSEPTYLRTKLVTDIRHRLGLSTISSNYARLYINGDYLGFFVLRDSIKSSWIKYEFGEKDTKSLYKCNNPSFLTMKHSSITCINDDDSIKDTSDLKKFLTTLDNAKSAADIENIFEVDSFLTDMALEFLFGAWDHFIYTGQNYYIYKQTNGKWKYIPYDHDFDMGINMERVGLYMNFLEMPQRTKRLLNLDFPNFGYFHWIKSQHHLIKILIYKDPRRFEKILKDIVVKVFNPDTLYPHIDELKKFIRPYVEKELNPQKFNTTIVKYNPNGKKPYTFEQWEANSEFTRIKTHDYSAYGLKYWILSKYRYMCRTYKDIQCNSTYTDLRYQYRTNKKIEFFGYNINDFLKPASIKKFEIPNLDMMRLFMKN